MTSPGGDFNVTSARDDDLPVFATECPITGYPIQIGGRWGAMIVLCLRARPRQFGVLRRHLPPVSAKVLAETLRSMERDGLVRRRPVTGAPDRAVEYELSELGHSLLPVIDHARRWGQAHLGELDSNRHDHDHAQASGTSAQHRGEKDQGTQSGADREPGAAVQPSTWHKGHLPRLPRDPSDNEPDFITGWLRERSLDGPAGHCRAPEEER